jgi:DNA-binding beta-propeller fold protein YncE
MKSKLILCGLLCVASSFCSGQYLETTIPTDNGAMSALLWNPTSNKLYCADLENGRILIVDGATNEILRSIPVAFDPVALAWNSRDNKVYCISDDMYWAYVIDGAGDTIIKQFNVSPCTQTIVYCEEENKVYLEGGTYEVVTVADAHRDTAIGLIPMSGLCHCAVWNPLTNLVFGILCNGDSVVTIDCVEDKIVRSTHVPEMPYLGCLNPVNGFVYIGCCNMVVALPPAGESVAAEVSVPSWPAALCAVPCPNKVYCAAGDICAINCDTHTPVWIRPGGTTSGVLCDTIAGKVYCSNSRLASVFIVDGWADTVMKSVSVGGHPSVMAWNSTNRRVYVAGCEGQTIGVIKEETGIEERPGPEVGGLPPEATVVRSLPAGSVVFDAMGRRVVDPKPGVYFVRAEPSAVGREPSAVIVRKVVVQR